MKNIQFFVFWSACWIQLLLSHWSIPWQFLCVRIYEEFTWHWWSKGIDGCSFLTLHARDAEHNIRLGSYCYPCHVCQYSVGWVLRSWTTSERKSTMSVGSVWQVLCSSSEQLILCSVFISSLPKWITLHYHIKLRQMLSTMVIYKIWHASVLFQMKYVRTYFITVKPHVTMKYLTLLFCIQYSQVQISLEILNGHVICSSLLINHLTTWQAVVWGIDSLVKNINKMEYSVKCLLGTK